MTDELFLQRTVIAGETVPGDYLGDMGGLPIGQIFKSIDVGGGGVYSWSCGLPNVPQSSSLRGGAGRSMRPRLSFAAHGKI